MLAERLVFPSSGRALQKERRPHYNPRCAPSAAVMEVCRYWLQGRCTRRSCPYAHPVPNKQSGLQQQQQNIKKQTVPASAASRALQNRTWHRPMTANAAAQVNDHTPEDVVSPANISRPRIETEERRGSVVSSDHPSPAISSCNCAPAQDAKGHQSSHEDAGNSTILKDCQTEDHHALDFITSLVGHDSAISGVVFPHASQILFSIGEDATLRAWDTRTGLGSDILQLAHPASCLFNSFLDPSWLFVGLPEEVLVCNIVTHTQQSLTVSSPVLSLSSLGNLLIAGLQQGTILVWRFEPSSASFHPLACLPCTKVVEGDHSSTASPVLSLEPHYSTPSSPSSPNIIYAGSADGMIRAWDLHSGRCLQALRAHDKAITQLLSCDHTSLLSASQDGTIKLWIISASCDQHQLALQATFLPPQSHKADVQSVQPQPSAICGVFDERNRPVLFAAYSDAKVYMLEVLPSNVQCRGAIRTESAIHAMDTGPHNVLLLGSKKGDISVWKWK